MKRHLLPFLGLLAIISIMTHPLILNFGAHIPGFFSTDEPYGVLWDSWRIKYSLSHRISLSHTPLIAYPFGRDLYTSGYFSYLWMGLIYFLSLITTPILTYNIQVFLNLLLSATFVYVLVFYLCKNRVGAFIAGIIFTFPPYQFVRIWQHLGLTYNQWIPLALFTAILLKEQLSNKNKILFLLSLLLLLSFDFSIMYLAGIALSVFFLYLLCFNWRTKFFKKRDIFTEELKYFKKIIIMGTIAFLILMPQFLPIFKNMIRPTSTISSAHNPYHRPFEDLFAQSARPLSYFLPSVTHPVFGNFTEHFVGTQLYGESLTEHTLYLGWVPLILAFVAFKRWRKNRKLRVTSYELRVTDREQFYIGFFVFLAIVAWLFSQPPWWQLGPLRIYMPTFLMYKILPMFRAYCRFGIVVMLAVAVLAGFGLKFILEKFKAQKIKIAITTLFCGLVLFEFWNYPPYKVIDVSRVPAVYYWLKEQPGDLVIAEYPLDIIGPNEKYKFFQTAHNKKIINGTIPGTYPHKIAKSIIKLSELKIAQILKWMGVKYVLVHRDAYLESELLEDSEELKRIPENNGLKFIRTFAAEECPQRDIMCVAKTGPIDVYEVVAIPVEPKVE